MSPYFCSPRQRDVDMTSQYDILVVGAGFAGAVCAERLASAGKRVLIIDRRSHIGGNAHDEIDAAGVSADQPAAGTAGSSASDPQQAYTLKPYYNIP